MERDRDFTANVKPRSLEIVTSCRVEPSPEGASPGSIYQFERLDYFCVDPDTAKGSLLFNRTVILRDTWAKIEKTLKKP